MKRVRRDLSDLPEEGRVRHVRLDLLRLADGLQHGETVVPPAGLARRPPVAASCSAKASTAAWSYSETPTDPRCRTPLGASRVLGSRDDAESPARRRAHRRPRCADTRWPAAGALLGHTGRGNS